MDVKNQFLFLLCNFCSTKGANCQPKNNLHIETVIHTVGKFSDNFKIFIQMLMHILEPVLP
jgi:hypothetical protein